MASYCDMKSQFDAETKMLLFNNGVNPGSIASGTLQESGDVIPAEDTRFDIGALVSSLTSTITSAPLKILVRFSTMTCIKVAIYRIGADWGGYFWGT